MRKTLLILPLALAGCSSAGTVLSDIPYACIDIQIDGPWTDSGAQGRGIKLPDGQTLTPETVAALCQ